MLRQGVASPTLQTIAPWPSRACHQPASLGMLLLPMFRCVACSLKRMNICNQPNTAFRWKRQLPATLQQLRLRCIRLLSKWQPAASCTQICGSHFARALAAWCTATRHCRSYCAFRRTRSLSRIQPWVLHVHNDSQTMGWFDRPVTMHSTSLLTQRRSLIPPWSYPGRDGFLRA